MKELNRALMRHGGYSTGYLVNFTRAPTIEDINELGTKNMTLKDAAKLFLDDHP